MTGKARVKTTLAEGVKSFVKDSMIRSDLGKMVKLTSMFTLQVFWYLVSFFINYHKFVC